MYLELQNEHLHFSSITKDKTSGYFKHTTGSAAMLLTHHSSRCSKVFWRNVKGTVGNESTTVTEVLNYFLLIMYICVSEQLASNTNTNRADY